MITLHEAIRDGEAALRVAGIDDPGWNAERLLMRALSIDRAALYADLQRLLTVDESGAFQALLDRRSAHEPLAYIEGTQEFFGREFRVNRSVLIPRPETEEIIRGALSLRLPPAPRVLDLGAGSGCLAVTLGLEIPRARVVALEKSGEALPVLRENCRGRAALVRGDLSAPPFLTESFDLVVSNPPYVEELDYDGLPAETRHEPRMALVPPSVEGMYRALLRSALRLLKSGGCLVFEIGAGQDPLIEKLLKDVPALSKIGSRSDFRGILRTFLLQKS